MNPDILNPGFSDQELYAKELCPILTPEF
jgi:hypothetical protein